MLFTKLIIYVTIIATVIMECIYCQEQPLFDLPVQLIGFPVIVLSVRLSNFAKKLAYSLSPATYQARSKRNIQLSETILNSKIAEREIIKEFGINTCIYEEPCEAGIHVKSKSKIKPNFKTLLKKAYLQSSTLNKWDAISFGVGEIVGDAEICNQLAKKFNCSNNYFK